MNEQDLLGKIKALKDIKPTHDFGALSRGLVLSDGTNSEISTNLAQTFKSLETITPRSTYAIESRATILNTTKRTPLVKLLTFQNIFKKNPIPAFSTAFATLLIVLMAGVSNFIRTPVSPILSNSGNNALINEAKKINADIDVHLKKINYYSVSASKTYFALNEASTSDANHVNDRILQGEADKTEINPPARNEKVDDLLNQASF